MPSIIIDTPPREFPRDFDGLTQAEGIMRGINLHFLEFGLNLSKSQ